MSFLTYMSFLCHNSPSMAQALPFFAVSKLLRIQGKRITRKEETKQKDMFGFVFIFCQHGLLSVSSLIT